VSILTSQEEPNDQQELLNRLCAYLRERFSCSTAILYGSRARGDWEPTSDIDVIAFGKADETGQIAHRWENLFLDLFVYPPGTMPSQEWLGIHDGRVLFQCGVEGDEVLAAVKGMFLSGPEKMSASAEQTTRLWLDKMLARAEKGDVEGDFRRHWLLKDVLEIYFLLRGRWYLGPKKSLALLKVQTPEHFEIFRQAFRPSASIADIQAAVNITNQLGR
jgi:predicted nucleotidyltransferase